MRHWCQINHRSQTDFITYYRHPWQDIRDWLVIKIEYSGYEEINEFKSMADWKEYWQDEADLCNENLDLYLNPPIWAGP
jgi:hypothetical protein